MDDRALRDELTTLFEQPTSRHLDLRTVNRGIVAQKRRRAGVVAAGTVTGIIAAASLGALLAPEAPPPLIASPSPESTQPSGPDAASQPGTQQRRRGDTVRLDVGAVSEDLARIAEDFVNFASGQTDAFPRSKNLQLLLSGEKVGTVARPADRATWSACPAGTETYGASLCPVESLGPIEAAAKNGVRVVASTQLDTVICAPSRSAPIPSGRLVVLRPEQQWRTCATDFAIVLSLTEDGAIKAVDVTLAAP